MIELEIMFTRKLFGMPDGGLACFAAEPIPEDRRKVSVDKRYGTFSLTGEFFIEEQEFYRPFKVVIEEDKASRYPNSYKLIQIKYELPLTAEEQWNYLEKSNLVSTLQFMNIKGAFSASDKIIDIIIDEKERILEVRGFGEAYANALSRRTESDRGRAIIYNRYGDIEGVGPSIIRSILKFNKDIDQTMKEIDANPFILMKVGGVGFAIADKFRAAVGIPLDDRNRCLHGISHYLTEIFQSTGDTYANALETLNEIQSKLKVNKEILLNYLLEYKNRRNELEKYNLFLFNNYITTYKLYKAEKFIKASVSELKSINFPLVEPEEWTATKEKILEENSFTLADEQNNFLESVNENRINVLVGAGGSGKSWVTRILCDMLTLSEKTFELYAPTARAAKIMTGYIGVRADTIHRGLLQYVLAGQKSNADVIIVDEASMIDSELMESVFKAMKPTARIVIIGDDFQLPSVSPGNVLYDLINFLDVPITKLTQVFRQEQESNILKYANNLKQGIFKIDKEDADFGDIRFINTRSDEDTQRACITEYKKAVEKVGDEEVMLLTPINRGTAGRSGFNKRIQEIVNPPSRSKSEMTFGKALSEKEQTHYRSGDLIAIKKNDYYRCDELGDEYPIINSDTGTIVEADDKNIYVDIDGHNFAFERDEVMSFIEHAWSLTVHKAQGGQADEVIIAIPQNGRFYLSANMTYTALTRAKKNVVVIGPSEVLNQTARKFVNYNRRTMLSLQQK